MLDTLKETKSSSDMTGTWKKGNRTFLNTIIENKNENPRYAHIFRIVRALADADFLRHFVSLETVFKKCGINGLILYFLNVLEEPRKIIDELLSIRALNIQEIYRQNDESVLLSTNGIYYSIEKANGITELKRLIGNQTFNSIEFDFSDREHTPTLLQIMFDGNSSYYQPARMSKYEALHYIFQLVRTNINNVTGDNLAPLLRTFNINGNDYVERDYLNFTNEANVYISSAIKNLPDKIDNNVLKHLIAKTDLRNVAAKYNIFDSLDGDKIENLRDKHEIFPTEPCFQRFCYTELLRADGIELIFINSFKSVSC